MNVLQILADQRQEVLNTDLRALIYRKEEKEINLNSSVAQIVVGVRRCGKSTLCKKVLLESGINFGYINFDDERLADFRASDFDELLKVLYQLNGDMTCLFIDEIQNVARWELFVNRMLRQGIKMVITGSNANLLGSDLTTHLAGRYNEIKLYPFSFAEVCAFKGLNAAGVTTKEIGLLQNELDKYLFSGGFPETVDGNAGPDYAMNLLRTIIYKDIVARYKIKYKETLWRLSNIVLDRVCQEQSTSKLAEELGIKSFHTADNYLSYLSNAYLVCLINKFSWKSVDRRRMPKSYAIDPAFISSHHSALITDAWGWRLENVIAIELLNRNGKASDAVYFLKESRNYEVDFCIVREAKITELIQVTYDFTNPSVKLYNREIGGLVKGAKKTGCQNLTLIVGHGKPGVVKVDGFGINVRLATEWLTSV